MESASPKVSPLVSSPFSSPKTEFLLKKRVLEWSQETGLHPLVHIRVGGKLFSLHKSPLVSKSGYFKNALHDCSDIELSDNFPGGTETFEMVALFSYDCPIPLDPFNVASMRCAAEFLQMTEDVTPRNLSERSDLYLNQVVLQNWDDTLIVLQKCQVLTPWSEELFIVSRCVESLAFMACMEILDPEQRRDQPVATLESLAGRSWNCEAVKEVARQDLWIKDLIALPFEFFQRIIESLRKQGMKEKYVSPIVVFYGNKWVLSKKTHKFWERSAEEDGGRDANSKATSILEAILKLLPPREMAGRVIPVAFYSALLSRSLTLNLSDESRNKLEDQVASILYLARLEDFLVPDDCSKSFASSAELRAMERIVLKYLSHNRETGYSRRALTDTSSIVAYLWDSYISQIAVDPKLEPSKFIDLVELMPMSDRENHDHLYQAMSTYLIHHPHLKSEEKFSICKYLNCQKLSQETCIQAVQNDQMPLRIIVQALFIQQIHTHRAFKDYSDSFRYSQPGDYSGSLSSSRSQIPISELLEESPYRKLRQEELPVAASVVSLIQKDSTTQTSGLMKAEYECTSFRIQALEQEVLSLKRTLFRNTSKEWDKKDATESCRLSGFERQTTIKKKRGPLGQSGSCNTSINWAFQRKYASRLLKVMRRLALFGKGRWKSRHPTSRFSNGPDTQRAKNEDEIYDC